MLTVALAKGRTADGVLPCWAGAKLPLPQAIDDSRALVFEQSDETYGLFRFLLAKPVDVPTYVAYGVADIGIVGKDILLESERDVYELLDLQTAQCRLSVAARPGEAAERPRRVATKYPRLADAYFRSRGQVVEIVTLSGSIELAAVIGMTDRIFDLVQSGATLTANGLIEVATVMDISARLIANRSSYRMKRPQIEAVVQALRSELSSSYAMSNDAPRQHGTQYLQDATR